MSETSKPFHLVLSHHFFPIQLLCPKTSLLGGAEIFQIVFIKFFTWCHCTSAWGISLGPHGWVLPRFAGALQRWRCWHAMHSLATPWLSVSLPGWPPGLSWARLLPSSCGKLCPSPWQYITWHHMWVPQTGEEDREAVYTAHHPLRSAC